MAETPAGWFPDPTRRSDHRYWDGSAWTEQVSTGGVLAVDALDGPRSRVDAPAAEERAKPKKRRAIVAGLVLVVAAGLLWTSCNGSSAKSSFEGTWAGTGYTCAVPAPKTEIIEIHEHRGTITAVKRKGDDCVRAGQRTFDGRASALRCWAGVPWGTPAGMWHGTLTIVSKNELKVVCGGWSTVLRRVNG